MATDDTKEKSSVQNDYDEMADEVIESLNQDGDFSGTAIEKPAEIKVEKVSMWSRPWFAFLGVLLVFNLVYFFVESGTQSQALEAQGGDSKTIDMLSDLPDIAKMIEDVSSSPETNLASIGASAKNIIANLPTQLQGAEMVSKAVNCGEGTCYIIDYKN